MRIENMPPLVGMNWLHPSARSDAVGARCLDASVPQWHALLMGRGSSLAQVHAGTKQVVALLLRRKRDSDPEVNG